jgi:hypothetical protein
MGLIVFPHLSRNACILFGNLFCSIEMRCLKILNKPSKWEDKYYKIFWKKLKWKLLFRRLNICLVTGRFIIWKKMNRSDLKPIIYFFHTFINISNSNPIQLISTTEQTQITTNKIKYMNPCFCCSTFAYQKRRFTSTNTNCTSRTHKNLKVMVYKTLKII